MSLYDDFQKETAAPPKPTPTPAPASSGSMYDQFKTEAAPAASGSLYDQFKADMAPKVTPPPEPSFFSKVGSAIGNAVQKTSTFLAGAAEDPVYTNDSWSQTFRNLPGEIVRTILPGAAALNDNPDLANSI